MAHLHRCRWFYSEGGLARSATRWRHLVGRFFIARLFGWSKAEEFRSVPARAGDFASDLRKAWIDTFVVCKSLLDHRHVIRFALPIAHQHGAGLDASGQFKAGGRIFCKRFDNAIQFSL